MKFRSILPVALVTAALLLGSACSSGDDDDAAPEPSTTQTDPGDAIDAGTEAVDTEPSDESEFVAALTAGMVESTGITGDPLFTQDQADCLSPRVVPILGVDELNEQGVTPEDLSRQGASLGFESFGLDDQSANEIYDSFGACDIDMVKFFVDGITASPELDDATITCVNDVVTDEKLRALMVGLMVVGVDGIDDFPEVAAFGIELQACAA